MMRFALAATAVAASISFAAMPAHADDAACMARFKELLSRINDKVGPVRIHTFSESAGYKSEGYFYSAGDGSIDGMSEPIEPKGGMWSLFRGNKMWFSNDGKKWQFGRVMDAASDPEAVKQSLKKNAETASKTRCGEQELDGVTYEVVEGEYVNSMAQNAVTQEKWWVRKENGFVTRHEATSNGAGGKFYSLQIIEAWPDLKLPSPE
jgi:hypothetical protein